MGKLAVKFRGCINYDYSQRLEISHLPIIIKPLHSMKFHHFGGTYLLKNSTVISLPQKCSTNKIMSHLYRERSCLDPRCEKRFASLVFENGGFWGSIHTKVGPGQQVINGITLPETNIAAAPKNGGFQQESPFPGVYFQGLC